MGAGAGALLLRLLGLAKSYRHWQADLRLIRFPWTSIAGASFIKLTSYAFVPEDMNETRPQRANNGLLISNFPWESPSRFLGFVIPSGSFFP